MGAWLATTLKSYDVAFTKDHSGARGRSHHLTSFMTVTRMCCVRRTFW